MKPTPWYRVPEAWLVVGLLAFGVFAGVAIVGVLVLLFALLLAMLFR